MSCAAESNREKLGENTLLFAMLEAVVKLNRNADVEELQSGEQSGLDNCNGGVHAGGTGRKNSQHFQKFKKITLFQRTAPVHPGHHRCVSRPDDGPMGLGVLVHPAGIDLY